METDDEMTQTDDEADVENPIDAARALIGVALDDLTVAQQGPVASRGVSAAMSFLRQADQALRDA